MLGKIGWRLITNPDALVCRVLKAKYFPQGDFMNATLGHSPRSGGVSGHLKIYCEVDYGGESEVGMM